MNPSLQNAQGRIKEAAGALIGNQDLKASGIADQSAAKASKALRRVANNAKGVVGAAANAATNAIDDAAKKLQSWSSRSRPGSGLPTAAESPKLGRPRGGGGRSGAGPCRPTVEPQGPLLVCLN